MQISIRRLSADVPMPEYKTSGACAFDIAVMEGVTLSPGGRATLPTGLVVEVPVGHVLILAPRGSNSKKGVRLANSIGIVDQDYCGPTDQLYLVLHNFGDQAYTVEKGERIAQGMIMPIAKVEFIEREAIGSVDRGGFGTTG